MTCVRPGAHPCDPEEQREHRSDALDGRVCSRLSDRILESLRELGTATLERGVGSQPEKSERLTARDASDGVPRHRARLVDGTERGEQIYEIRAATHGGHRETTAEDLTET